MRNRIAHDFATDHARQFGAAQNAFDGPDCSVSRLQYAVVRNAHREANDIDGELFGFADMGHEVFRHIQFQHTHSSAPWLLLLRNAVLRHVQWNHEFWNFDSKAYRRSTEFLIASRFASDKIG